MFYAVFRRSSLVGNFRNGCISADGKKKYHFYSLSKATLDNDNAPWTNGMLYILPNHTFTHRSKGIIEFDEWTSNEAVKPIIKLEVDPSDFYYLNRVSTLYESIVSGYKAEIKVDHNCIVQSYESEWERSNL